MTNQHSSLDKLYSGKISCYGYGICTFITEYEVYIVPEWILSYSWSPSNGFSNLLLHTWSL